MGVKQILHSTKAHAVQLGYSQVFLLQTEQLLYLRQKIVFKSTQLKLDARFSCFPQRLAKCERGVWPISYDVQNPTYSLLRATGGRKIPAPEGNVLDLSSLVSRFLHDSDFRASSFALKGSSALRYNFKNIFSSAS